MKCKGKRGSGVAVLVVIAAAEVRQASMEAMTGLYDFHIVQYGVLVNESNA